MFHCHPSAFSTARSNHSHKLSQNIRDSEVSNADSSASSRVYVAMHIVWFMQDWERPRSAHTTLFLERFHLQSTAHGVMRDVCVVYT